MVRPFLLSVALLLSLSALGCGSTESTVVTGHDVNAIMAEEAAAEAAVAAAAAAGEFKEPAEN